MKRQNHTTKYKMRQVRVRSARLDLVLLQKTLAGQGGLGLGEAGQDPVLLGQSVLELGQLQPVVDGRGSSGGGGGNGVGIDLGLASSAVRVVAAVLVLAHHLNVASAIAVTALRVLERARIATVLS